LDRIPLDLVNRSRGILLVQQSEELRIRPLAEQAIPLLTPWVSSHSDDTQALAVLGTAYYFTQDTRNALAMLDLSLAIDPNSEYALRQRMNFSHELGDLEGGIRYGRRLIAINPHHYDYHGRMAHMLGQKGQWSEAIDSALKAAEIRPWSSQIHGWLAEAYEITGQHELSLKHAAIYEELQSPGRSEEQ
jgi:tetratricopeptide (TPR) repeat protein